MAELILILVHSGKDLLIVNNFNKVENFRSKKFRHLSKPLQQGRGPHREGDTGRGFYELREEGNEVILNVLMIHLLKFMI